jgi:hypothetical protein
MKIYRVLPAMFAVVCLLAMGGARIHAQDKAAASTLQVHMVITDQAMRDGSEVPVLRPENVAVKQGKTALKVDHLIPARGDAAGLQLFILIDDTCDTSIGNNLNDIRAFINAQPASTVIAVGYMANATVQIAQNFTADKALAAKAIRLPRGSSSTMDSPYLSLISAVSGWPEQKVRREILMVSDGIDRLRGDTSSLTPIPSRGGSFPTTRSVSNSMSTISPDADRASNTSQRYGVIVHSIYSPGVGRMGRNMWEAQLGQGGVAKIADETGGEFFALGTQNPVSFKPYLDRLQIIFDNQYFLVFQAAPKSKAGLQRVKISTTIDNADIASADNVWVPASK